MKNLWLLLLATGISAGTLFAQEQKPASVQEQKAVKEDWNKKIKDELKLTDEQVVKYDALSKEYKDKFDALQADASLGQDAQKEKKMALKKEKEAKFMEILTPDQQEKYKVMMKEAKEKMDKEKNKDGKAGY